MDLTTENTTAESRVETEREPGAAMGSNGNGHGEGGGHQESLEHGPRLGSGGGDDPRGADSNDVGRVSTARVEAHNGVDEALRMPRNFASIGEREILEAWPLKWQRPPHGAAFVDGPYDGAGGVGQATIESGPFAAQARRLGFAPHVGELSGRDAHLLAHGKLRWAFP